MYSKFDDKTKELAEALAISVNGGSWDKDYTEAQKIGWCLKIQWMQENYKL